MFICLDNSKITVFFDDYPFAFVCGHKNKKLDILFNNNTLQILWLTLQIWT